jgi:putative transposase
VQGGDNLNKAIKIRLFPTKEQEILMFKSIGCSRFVYNWALNRCNERYEQGEKYSIKEIRKEFTQFKKNDNYKWLNEVSNTTVVEAIRNLDKAFQNFFKRIGKYPKFKTKRKSRQSFYVRYDRLNFKDNVCHIEKIGKVKFKTNYEIPKSKYKNPYCSYDGRYWYLSFGIEVEENQTTLNKDLSLGIDLGVKDLAVCSNEIKFKNINKTKRVKKLKKRLKRLQKQVSRKYEANKEGNKFVKTNNIIKLEKQIKLLYRKLSNIRNNHIHQATNKIIKLKPYRIVMENLNVSGMMKNKHLSKAIAEQCFYEFIRQIKK